MYTFFYFKTSIASVVYKKKRNCNYEYCSHYRSGSQVLLCLPISEGNTNISEFTLRIYAPISIFHSPKRYRTQGRLDVDYCCQTKVSSFHESFIPLIQSHSSVFNAISINNNLCFVCIKLVMLSDRPYRISRHIRSGNLN